MNKNQFLTELNQYLTFLTSEERAEVIAGYTAKFDAVCSDGEAALILELGTPTMIAIDLKRQKEAGKAIIQNPQPPDADIGEAIESQCGEAEEPAEADTAEESAPSVFSEPARKGSKSILSIIGCSLLSLIIGVFCLAIAGVGVYLVVSMGNLLLTGLQSLYQITNALLLFGGGLIAGALGLLVIWFALWSAISLIARLFKPAARTAAEGYKE